MSLGEILLYIYVVGFLINAARMLADWDGDYDIIDCLLGPFDLILDAIKVIVKALKRRYKKYKEH